jgi:hypothetical protein
MPKPKKYKVSYYRKFEYAKYASTGKVPLHHVVVVADDVEQAVDEVQRRGRVVTGTVLARKDGYEDTFLKIDVSDADTVDVSTSHIFMPVYTGDPGSPLAKRYTGSTLVTDLYDQESSEVGDLESAPVQPYGGITAQNETAVTAPTTTYTVNGPDIQLVDDRQDEEDKASKAKTILTFSSISFAIVVALCGFALIRKDLLTDRQIEGCLAIAALVFVAGIVTATIRVRS